MMILNNFRLALRRLTRQKVNTTLHVIGLTLGMSVCLLIGLFLRYELTFDSYQPLATRTYRVTSVWKEAGKENYHYSTPMPLADALRTQVTGLEHVTRIHPEDGVVIEINPQKRFIQDRVAITDPEFLEVFKVDVLEGDARRALGQPYQALLTESTAKKFYGGEDPVGKTFLYRNKFNITVAGVIRDLPSNTHLPASMLLSFVPDEDFLRNRTDGWTYVSGTTTFVVLPEGATTGKLETQLKTIADKQINSNPHMPKFLRSDFALQRLADIHYQAQYDNGGNWVHSINPSWLWFFAGIGMAVLILACINFVNLSTAQALTRAREVGVRKSIGAGKGQLIAQFLGEAGLLATISGGLAIAFAQGALPSLNTLLEKGITFHLTESPGLLLALAGGVVATTFMAGLYPAWIIARFNAASALKVSAGGVSAGGSSWLRKGLVVVQFTISAGLLMALYLMAAQVNYMRNKSLGFDRENVISVDAEGKTKQSLLANELGAIHQITDFAFSTSTPSDVGHWGTIMTRTNGDDPNRKRVTMLLADDHFSKLYGLKLLTGRFTEARDTNSASSKLPEAQQVNKVVVNETAVRALGFESNEAAIGNRFWFGMNSGHAEIIGVVADFNTGSLHQAIEPTLLLSLPDTYGLANIKIAAHSDIPQTIAAIESAWKKVYPQGVFKFKFLDQKLDDFYKAETRLYTLFKVFSGLAMLISCLGLWGLAAHAAQQRTKEIGIRKVLGATANGIVLLLSRDFMILIFIALAVASPLAYYSMNDWLSTFAFRIDIGWKVFLMAGFVSFFLALVTVSFQALKAAWANPVDSLRAE